MLLIGQALVILLFVLPIYIMLKKIFSDFIKKREEKDELMFYLVTGKSFKEECEKAKK